MGLLGFEDRQAGCKMCEGRVEEEGGEQDEERCNHNTYFAVPCRDYLDLKQARSQARERESTERKETKKRKERKEK